jgi:hypothetical protein
MLDIYVFVAKHRKKYVAPRPTMMGLCVNDDFTLRGIPQ